MIKFKIRHTSFMIEALQHAIAIMDPNDPDDKRRIEFIEILLNFLTKIIPHTY